VGKVGCGVGSVSVDNSKTRLPLDTSFGVFGMQCNLLRPAGLPRSVSAFKPQSRPVRTLIHPVIGLDSSETQPCLIL
jgi:hypothetical protein